MAQHARGRPCVPARVCPRCGRVEDRERAHAPPSQPPRSARGRPLRAHAARPKGARRGGRGLAARPRRHRGAQLLRRVHRDAEG
jgi:hypothetical protein